MIKKCIICNREFEAYNKPVKGSRHSIRRPVNSKTCSRSCSKINAYGKPKLKTPCSEPHTTN